jgi:predicted transposase YbfD/YdcC
MIPQPRPLIEVFSDIPDVRQSRGKRHPLAAILALSCCAMLCGARSYSAIAEWGRNYGSTIAHALGFTHNTPCASTLHTIFGRIDCEGFEATLGVWADSVVAHTPTMPEAPEAAMAVDGKTLRGSKKQGAPGTHLLSVLAHRLGLTLTQQAVAAQTNEIKAVETVFSQIVLTGRVVTMDALLTQRQVAQTIVDAGGDYVMIVKENQPQLKAEIALVFTLPPAGDRQESVRTVDVGHGRIETRNLTTSEALVGYSDWPGLAQVFEVGRHVITKKTGTERVEVVYGVTSLSSERATPGRVLELVRGHWAIENKSHWVRDVTFDEDRSQVRGGHIPQVMAALRNTAIGLLRWAGHINIAAACRRLAAQPTQALALIGIEFEN